MANERLSLPSGARKALEAMGYTIDDTMAPHVARWWSWYTRAAGEQDGDVHDFYNVPYSVTVRDGGGQRKASRTRRRMSLNPAARACQEWASLVLNEDTEVSVSDGSADEWLGAWVEANDFWPTGQQMVERAYATGTGAWALWADVRQDAADTVLRLRTYDARMIVPLSWDDDGVSECAFCTKTHVGGKPYDQLQVHRLGDAGTYVVETLLFDREGERVDPGALGLIAEWDSGCATPTFAVVRPGISNTLSDTSPCGVSVFDRATGGAIQAVDMAFDALYQEVVLTEAMVFLDEALVDVRSADGRFVPVPAGDGDRKFVTLAGESGKDLYEVYSPAIRTAPLREALEVALAEFGDQCGFGQDYFAIDKPGGLRTATEVSADSSALMRNVRKHENEMRKAIKRVAAALLTCARIHCAAPVPEDFGDVDVQFDDSIIVDTQTEKATMLDEIAAGVVPRWMYLERFYGMPEEQARAEAGDMVVDEGF